MGPKFSSLIYSFFFFPTERRWMMRVLLSLIIGHSSINTASAQTELNDSIVMALDSIYNAMPIDSAFVADSLLQLVESHRWRLSYPKDATGPHGVLIRSELCGWHWSFLGVDRFTTASTGSCPSSTEAFWVAPTP